MHTKVRLFVFYYIAHASPQPFFNYTTAIIANHHPSQWFPVQSTHTSTAVLFCDITKSSENVIADIVHYLSSYMCAILKATAIMLHTYALLSQEVFFCTMLYKRHGTLATIDGNTDLSIFRWICIN